MDENLISSILPNIIPVSAIIISLYTYYSSKRFQSYSDLDNLYLELLKLGMDYPKFRNPKYTLNYKEQFKGDELHQYETMAFIAWNICETIYDRMEDEKLFETWKTAIYAENELHRKWFDAPENYPKFKERFGKFIRENFEKPY